MNRFAGVYSQWWSRLLMALFTSCSVFEEQVAGTDTGNPEIAGVLLDSLGQPLAQAQVILYADSSDLTASLSRQGRLGAVGGGKPYSFDTVYTDSLGRFAAARPSRATHLALEAYWQDSLGLYTSLAEAGSDSLSLVLAPLVVVPVQSPEGVDSTLALVAQTGRVLHSQQNAKLPQGLWDLEFTLFHGDTSTVALPPLQVGFLQQWSDDFLAIASLADAARILDSMDVATSDYVELSPFPIDSVIGVKVEDFCNEAGYPDVGPCVADPSQCKIWQWQSDWVYDASDTEVVPVLVASISYQGRSTCLFFPREKMSSHPIFYSQISVRKGP